MVNNQLPGHKMSLSHPEVFLVKGVLKICRKFTGEHPCRSVISIKLLCNFIKVILWHGCSSLSTGKDVLSVSSTIKTICETCKAVSIMDTVQSSSISIVAIFEAIFDGSISSNC